MLLAGCLVLSGCGAPEPETGAPDVKTAVEAYVRGLNGNDYAAIARLAPPQNDASAEIRRRLAVHGGQNIKLESLDISSEITPKIARAELEGFGNRGRYKETLQLEREEGRWHIALGRNPDPVRSRETSSTTRP